MVHFGTIFTKARDGAMFRPLQSTLTCPKHCYEIPHATLPTRRTTPDQVGTNRESTKIDRSISLTGEIDIQLRYSRILRVFIDRTSTIRNRSRSPYALFSTDRIDSIQDEQYRIETCIDYRDRALFLSFSIYREQLIVRDQDPGTWNLDLRMCTQKCVICTGVARTIRTSAAHVLLCSVILLLSWLSLCEETPVRTSTHGGYRTVVSETKKVATERDRTKARDR